MEIDWRRIRTHRRSQSNAFEELVCQLAYNHKPSLADTFYRVEAPDGGVEAYWILKNGDEIGWQAKYHIDAFGISQWRQIEESFKQALDKHPKLKEYYVALPINFEDPRVPNQKSKQDKWNEYVAKWETIAKASKRNIRFHFWGRSQLEEQLTRDANSGRRAYWFNQQELTEDWFRLHLYEAIRNLGSRYTKKLNFELDIAKAFDGIYRSEAYHKTLEKHLHLFLVKGGEVMNHLPEEGFDRSAHLISEQLKALKSYFHKISYDVIQPLDVEGWSNHLRIVAAECDTITERLNELDPKDKEEKIAKGLIKKDDTYYLHYSHLFSYEKQLVRDLDRLTSDLFDYVNGQSTEGFNKPFILLKGEKGMGKSHLLADISLKKREVGNFTLLVLGQQLGIADPWTQILAKFGWLGNKEEFLGALDAKAQSIQSRIVIMIDAINEGGGLQLWESHLPGFIETISRYKWLGLVVSIRTPYDEVMFESSFWEDNFCEVEHHGFEDSEYEAAKVFFQEAGIEQPKIPLLLPEFRQPLFLKLFCDALKKAGKTTIPKEGYNGISEIMNFLVKAINKEISDSVGCAPSLNITQKALDIFMQGMIKRGKGVLLYDDAHILLEDGLSQYRISSGILEHLIGQGLLGKSLIWDNGQYIEGVYFSYQRYEDHFRAKYYLDSFYNPETPMEAFEAEGEIGKIFIDNHSALYNSGLFEALAIQIPEVTGLELFEVFPHLKEYTFCIHAVIDSLQWRKSETINQKVVDYISEYLSEDILHRFLGTVLLISGKPKHYLNAEFLDHWLSRMKMAKRDVVWTAYINRHFDRTDSVKRLVDWGWSDEDKKHITDESLFLVGITLSWFLTSSNRNLRDAATKALTSVMRNRLTLAAPLINKFKSVDDVGVIERIVAAAYGAAMTSRELQGLKDLGQGVFDTFFKSKYVIPHILLRDYARNIIEYAVHRGCRIDGNIERISPPYTSKWYQDLLPLSILKSLQYDHKAEEFKKHYWSQNVILDSILTGRDDFDRDALDRISENWNISNEEIQQVMITRVFELGYDVNTHGVYDRKLSDYRRNDDKIETIGKKYQWQAFYELAAKASDHKKFRNRYSNRYTGPWEPYLRDIDPSLLIAQTKEEGYRIKSKQWYNTMYTGWMQDDKKWIHSQKDIPSVNSLINITDDAGTEWLVLDSSLRWEAPRELGADRYRNVDRDLVVEISSFLIPSENKDVSLRKIRSAVNTKYFDPHRSSVYEVFSGEYYWSPSYVEHFQEDYKTAVEVQGIKLLYTSFPFTWEQGLDHSKAVPIRYFKPSKVLFDGMKMTISSKEGEYLGDNGQIVCLDPAVNNTGSSCLLVNKNELMKFLKKAKLTLIWNVNGRKRIYGHRVSDKSYWGEGSFKGIWELKEGEVVGRINYQIQERG